LPLTARALFGLNVTDDGIELRGPSGLVKITNAGIEIGSPDGSRVVVTATDLDLSGNGTVKVRSRETVEIVNGPGFNVLSLSSTGVELRSGGGVNIGMKGATPNGVRITANGTEIGGPSSRIKMRATDMDVRADMNLRLNTNGMADFAAARLRLGACPGQPAARVGDAVQTNPGYTGKISAGSSMVFVC
jgi:hypothetical protein